MASVENARRVSVCKQLRSKEMFHSENPMEEDLYHSGIYWCHHTAEGLGPDGGCVDSEECLRSRECFEA